MNILGKKGLVRGLKVSKLTFSGVGSPFRIAGCALNALEVSIAQRSICFLNKKYVIQLLDLLLIISLG